MASDRPQPNLNPDRIEDLEDKIVAQIEKKAELRKLEEDAKAELARGDGAALPEPRLERRLLMLAAGIMIFTMPILQYFWSIVLTAFALIVSLIAGFTSVKAPYGAGLNIVISSLGTLIFEYFGIYEFHAHGAATLLFWTDELLALVFLFATYFSMRTYRRKALEEI